MKIWKVTMIAVNQVFKHENERDFIVLWVNEKYTHAYIYYLDNDKMPELIGISEIEESATTATDEYLKAYQDNELPEKYILKRNIAWNLIKSLVVAEPEIYQPKLRGNLVTEVVHRHKSSKKVIYSLLKKYWKRGKNKNSLLPDYKNCGLKDNIKYEAKPGRKRAYAEISGNGILITDKIMMIFQTVFNEHNKAADKRSLRYSYNKMLNDYFKDEIENSAIGQPKNIPSYHQFIRRYRKKYSIDERIKAKKGDKKYNKDSRPILNNSKMEALGPAHKYQIDATKADIYLVSELNSNWNVGRPVIYFCIDVFSRMVAGMYIGFKEPSMDGAKMAILNCVADKVKYCKKFGVDIDKEDWPASTLPSIFLGDNGELKGKTPEKIIDALGIKLENTGSYRADCKGIVERYFKIIHDKIAPFAPGFVQKDFKERGTEDYRLDAKLNIKEFTALVMHMVIEHNNKIIEDYPFHKDIATAGIEHKPNKLWSWGVKNSSGHAREIPIEQLNASLLPSKRATVTPKGIRLNKDIHYTHPIALAEGWFTRSKNSPVQKVELVYNPRDLNQAYIKHQGKFLEVTMTPGSITEEICLEDYMRYEEHLKKQKVMNEDNSLRNKLKTQDAVEGIVKKASDRYEKTVRKTSKKKKIEDIRGNKAIARDLEEKQEKYERLSDKDNYEVKKTVDTPDSDMLKKLKSISKKKKKSYE